MLVPIFIGSLIGFALSTWVRAQMGIWSLFPVAILKKLFPGEEGHKVPGYDRIISWHALFACVWMFVCMLQLASYLLPQSRAHVGPVGSTGSLESSWAPHR